jgi:predicted nuclease of predicted toxin-antitoxin system
MRLLLDMNLAPRWCGRLIEGGHEAVHWSSVGEGEATDAEILAYAKDHGFIVLTHDLDFGAILAATGGDGPSVAQIRAEDPSPEAIGVLLLAGLRQMADDLNAGALVTIEPGRSRLRLLPLRRRNENR